MTKEQLQLWHDYLGVQIEALDAAYLNRAGKSHRADTLIAFLELSDAMPIVEGEPRKRTVSSSGLLSC